MAKNTRSLVLSYGSALAAFAVLIAVALAFSKYRPDLTLPILVCLGLISWYGGRGPGITFVALIIVATVILRPPPPEASVPGLILAYVTVFGLLSLVVWLITLVRDSRRRNNELRRQNELLLNSVGEGIVGADAEGLCTFANPAAAAITGWKVQDLIGNKVHDVLHHSRADGTPYAIGDCPATAALKEGKHCHAADEVFWKKDGTSFPVEYTSTPMLENGKVIGGVTVFRDVTAQRRSENELRQQAAALVESEIRYRRLFESNPLPMWVYDRESLAFLAVNAAAVMHYGYSREEFLSMNIKQIRPPEDVPALLNDIARSTKPLQPADTWRHRKKDGTVIDVEVTSHEIDFDGQKARLVLANDITERKKAEVAIQNLNETLEQRVADRTAALEALNKELESFSYSVSHDLRAPLRAIDGFARIFAEDHGEKLDGEGKRLLSIIRDNARNMGKLIDDLLAFSRLGRQPIDAAPIDMTDLANSVCQELTPNGDGPPCSFDIGPLPAAFGDRSLMRQVLFNLFSNAVKYSSTRTDASVKVGSDTAETENIYYIRDNGVGFDMNYSSKLFGVFQRLHGQDEFEGTGVGLAIVQRVIQRHGGRVWAEGEVDKGATFYFALPKNGSALREMSQNGK